MNIKLAENIKALRKERKMTQEQLAEALGVTVGAVYKWERDLSTPDISLIMEMADLFETSTDMLLGYEWRAGSAGTLLKRIIELTKDRNYDAAAVEAEKALKKFPNHFEVVYQSALMYLAKSEHISERKQCSRAIELLDHACELLSQNQDLSISEISIRNLIAKAYLMLGDTSSALETLKKYNVCGVNNAMIGMVYGDYLHDANESERYLGKTFGAYLVSINEIMVGYANIFFQRKEYQLVIDCLQWLRNTLRGIQPANELTWYDKYDCVLLETIAETYCFMGSFENARQYLKAALELAVKYDLANNGEIKNAALFDAMHIENQPSYDMYGKTAMECLQRRIHPDDDSIPRMLELWDSVRKEVLGYETV